MLYLWWSNDHALDIMLLCLLYYCHCLPLLGGMSCTHYCLTTLSPTVSWSPDQHHNINTTLCLTVLTPHSYLSIVLLNSECLASYNTLWPSVLPTQTIQYSVPPFPALTTIRQYRDTIREYQHYTVWYALYLACTWKYFQQLYNCLQRTWR